MLLRIGLYVIPALLFLLWGYLLVTDIRKHTAFRRKHHLKFFWGLPHLRQMVENRNDENLKREYEEIRNWTRKRMQIWIFSMIIAVVILVFFGMLSSTAN